MMPSETRERLSHGIYKTIEPGNAAGQAAGSARAVRGRRAAREAPAGRGRQDRARHGARPARAIEQALGIGLLDAREAQLLRDYDRKVMDIVNVDDFSTEELMAG